MTSPLGLNTAMQFCSTLFIKIGSLSIRLSVSLFVCHAHFARKRLPIVNYEQYTVNGIILS